MAAAPLWVNLSPYLAASLLHLTTVTFGRGEYGGSWYTLTKSLPALVLVLSCLFLLKPGSPRYKYHTTAMLFQLVGEYFIATRSVSKTDFALGTVLSGLSQLFYLKA